MVWMADSLDSRVQMQLFFFIVIVAISLFQMTVMNKKEEQL